MWLHKITLLLGDQTRFLEFQLANPSIGVRKLDERFEIAIGKTLAANKDILSRNKKIFRNNLKNAHFPTLSRVIYRWFNPLNGFEVLLNDPELFPIITNPNAKDGHLCKMNTFQFLKSVS